MGKSGTIEMVSRGIEYMLFNREFVTINLKICNVSELTMMILSMIQHHSNSAFISAFIFF